MAVLVDTDLLVDWERAPDGAALAELASNEDRSISVITVSELLHGVHRATGTRRVRRRALVERLLDAFDPLPITQAVARVHAEVWADLSARGQALAAHDLWIAATALTYGLGLVTRNGRDFARVPGLRVLSAEGTGGG